MGHLEKEQTTRRPNFKSSPGNLRAYFALHESFPVGIRQAQKIVQRVTNKDRIASEVSPHILRHSFATLFLQKGGSLAALKKILGHDRLATSEIYLNLTDKHVVDEYLEKW